MIWFLDFWARILTHAKTHTFLSTNGDKHKKCRCHWVSGNSSALLIVFADAQLKHVMMSLAQHKASRSRN